MPKILISANTDWYLYNYRMAYARSLREHGFKVILVSPSGQYTSAFRESGFRWIPWEVSRKGAMPWVELGSLVSLVRIYREEMPDLVHHHTIKPVIYGSIAGRLVDIPCVVNSITGRGRVFSSGGLPNQLIKSLVSVLYKFAFKHPNIAIIFENAADKDFFVDSRYLDAQRTWVIGGVGADPEIFSPSPEPQGVPVILLSGRMLWDKGVGVLVQAARELKRKMDVRIVLVGEPDPGNSGSIDENILKAWQDEGVIEWWGWKSDMPTVYRECHIVTLPTRYGEGVPTSLIEGAACGKPLVASTIPGCRTIVHPGENGLLVDPDDPEELAQALEDLISNPERRQAMGKKSREVFLEKFTYDRINEATMRVYDHVLQNSPD